MDPAGGAKDTVPKGLAPVGGIWHARCHVGCAIHASRRHTARHTKLAILRLELGVPRLEVVNLHHKILHLSVTGAVVHPPLPEVPTAAEIFIVSRVPVSVSFQPPEAVLCLT